MRIHKYEGIPGKQHLQQTTEKNNIDLAKNDLEQPSRLGKETKYTNQTREHFEHPPRIGIKTATHNA